MDRSIYEGASEEVGQMIEFENSEQRHPVYLDAVALQSRKPEADIVPFTPT